MTRTELYHVASAGSTLADGQYMRGPELQGGLAIVEKVVALVDRRYATDGALDVVEQAIGNLPPHAPTRHGSDASTAEIMQSPRHQRRGVAAGC